MARALVAVQTFSDLGLEPAFTTPAIADGISFVNDGKTFLLMKSATGTGNVTVQTPRTVAGLAVSERVLAVTANKVYLMGPFPEGLYEQADGKVYVDVAMADLSVAVVRYSE